MRPASEPGQRPTRPVYLASVLTVEAELSAGWLYDGSPHQDTARPVAAALVFTGGTAMLLTEDADGRITRLRLPEAQFLRLTQDAPGRLARSRQPGSEPAGPRSGHACCPAAQASPGTPPAQQDTGGPAPVRYRPGGPVTREAVYDHMSVLAARHAAGAYPGQLDGDPAGQLFALLTDTALAYQMAAETTLSAAGPDHLLAAVMGLTALDTLTAGLTGSLHAKAGSPAGLPVNPCLTVLAGDTGTSEGHTR